MLNDKKTIVIILASLAVLVVGVFGYLRYSEFCQPTLESDAYMKIQVERGILVRASNPAIIQGLNAGLKEAKRKMSWGQWWLDTGLSGCRNIFPPQPFPTLPAPFMPTITPPQLPPQTQEPTELPVSPVPLVSPLMPEVNPDPKDNLNTGPIDEQEKRLYRNEAFGFEVKYPASFKAERWLLVVDAIAPRKVGVNFTGELKDGIHVKLAVLASQMREDVGMGMLCGEGGCDGPPGTINFAGQKWDHPSYYSAWTKHNNIFFAIGISAQDGRKTGSTDSIFQEFTESFHFLKSD